MQHHHLHRAITRLVFALALSTTTASAQSASQPGVRVAIPDRFPLDDARAIVVRYSSNTKPDVIVLSGAHATSETLSAALVLLGHLGKVRPATPGRYIVAPLKGFAPLRRPDAATVRHLDAQLAALRAQPPSRIGNLGRGRWIPLSAGRAR